MSTMSQDVAPMFEIEWRTYRDHKAELLANFEGQYVVIRGEQILGTYPTAVQGFTAGVRAFGPERFFLRRILETDPQAFSPPFIGMVAVGSRLKYPEP